MTGRSLYFRRSRVSAAKFRWLVRLFCLDMEATKIAQLTGLNRNSVNLYCRHFRERIATLCEAESPLRVEDVRVECQRPTGDVAASVRRGLVLVVMHVAIAS